MSDITRVVKWAIYGEGVRCCGKLPTIEEIDTGRRWQSRYEYRVRCRSCSRATTQCTWKPDAKRLWDAGETTN